MSASWCLVSMYFIWIFGTKLILSNNQSRATLWVRETCLFVGLLPLIIFLITASLSAKTNNIALESEFFVLDGMWSMSVGMTLVCLHWMKLCMLDLTIADGSPVALSWVLQSCKVQNDILQSPNLPQRGRAGRPSMRKAASREILSASVELCETEVCFLHIQHIGTNV